MGMTQGPGGEGIPLKNLAPGGLEEGKAARVSGGEGDTQPSQRPGDTHPDRAELARAARAAEGSANPPDGEKALQVIAGGGPPHQTDLGSHPEEIVEISADASPIRNGEDSIVPEVTGSATQSRSSADSLVPTSRGEHGELSQENDATRKQIKGPDDHLEPSPTGSQSGLSSDGGSQPNQGGSGGEHRDVPLIGGDSDAEHAPIAPVDSGGVLPEGESGLPIQAKVSEIPPAPVPKLGIDQASPGVEQQETAGLYEPKRTSVAPGQDGDTPVAHEGVEQDSTIPTPPAKETASTKHSIDDETTVAVNNGIKNNKDIQNRLGRYIDLFQKEGKPTRTVDNLTYEDMKELVDHLEKKRDDGELDRQGQADLNKFKKLLGGNRSEVTEKNLLKGNVKPEDRENVIKQLAKDNNTGVGVLREKFLGLMEAFGGISGKEVKHKREEFVNYAKLNAKFLAQMVRHNVLGGKYRLPEDEYKRLQANRKNVSKLMWEEFRGYVWKSSRRWVFVLLPIIMMGAYFSAYLVAGQGLKMTKG